MRVGITAFWLPKAGNAPEEYEDAFCPEDGGEKQGKRLRFAVADGATEGMLSGQWARTLTKTFCLHDTYFLDVSRFLEKAYRTWDSWIEGYLHDRRQRNKPIEWFEEPGLQAGAFSTFLGLVLKGDKGERVGRWKAMALGDSCLVQLRGGKLLTTFPMNGSAQFSNRPLLVSSNPGRNQAVLESIQSVEGKWRLDDRFYLMTDALAHWFLQEHESGGAPWVVCGDLDADDQAQPFKDWIGQLRAEHRIRNDDVTLVRIDLMLEI